VVLVSSGAIAPAWRRSGCAPGPRDLATQQAAASVGQGVLVHRYTEAFARHGLRVGQVLLTAEDVIRRTHYRNAQRTFYRLLAMGAVPVVNENDTVATDEIRFGDNDRLAALVAHLVACRPAGPALRRRRALRRRPRAAGDRADRGRPRSGDLDGHHARPPGPSRCRHRAGWRPRSRPRIATSAGRPRRPRRRADARGRCVATPSGTFFAAGGGVRRPRCSGSRTRPARGAGLLLDAGSRTRGGGPAHVAAPAGIVGVEGDFSAGDPVDLLDETGHAVARGLVNFDAAELPGLLGRSTRALAEELGAAYEREVVPS
jgi:glutamate 5-kinase